MQDKITGWEQSNIHIQDYLFLLKKRLWLIVACFVVVFSLAILYNAIQTPLYQAASTIEIHENKNRVSLPNQQPYSYNNYIDKQRVFETHFKVLKSYPVIGRVVERLQLKKAYKQEKEKHRGIRAMLSDLNRFIQTLLDRILAHERTEQESNVDVPTFDPVVSAVQGSITISPVVDTNLANLICTHTDPALAVRIANTLAEVYKDYIDRKQVDMNRESFDWISKEIERLRKKLDISEDELHKYKEKSKIFSMETDKNIEAREISQTRSDYNATLARKNELQAQVRELENIIRQNKRHVPEFARSEILKNIGNKLVKAQLELNRLYKTYKHKHPLVIKAKAHIATLEEQFYRELTKITGGIKSQIQVLLSKEKTLTATLEKYREQAIRSTPKNIRFNRLHKETQANSELYNYLMKQLKSLDIREEIKEREVFIVERAKLPTNPIRPRKRMNIIMGVAVGLVLGVSLAFFIEYMDRSIKNVEEVERLLELPVLGIIPGFDKERI
jgi:uncharacterized protein involved in exopolysaccharide biosynthesis